MKTLLLISLAALATAAPATFDAVPALSVESRIIGGSPADITNFPYQLSLRFTGSHTCGAVVASANRALTAAHCTDGRVIGGFTLYAGSTSRVSGGILYSSLAKDEHSGYNNGQCTFCNDICMLSLSTNMDLDNSGIGAISMAAASDFAGTTCTLSGWGRTSSSNILPTNLQQVDMGVISNTECQTRMNPVSGANVGIQHICIFSGSQGSCNGDSGGPMRCTEGGAGVLAGITSWGISSGGACSTSYPSVYVRVTTFLSWIAERM
uniref:Fibrinolytic enzyme n=1 Tax=Urechis unicinctus TaxID=6432 RepID=E0AD99_UREUN|nr:fibrinolytic enzyme [Urechis unicinctus]